MRDFSSRPYIFMRDFLHFVHQTKTTTDNKDNRLSLENNDYAEILRQRVEVIEHARPEIARHINGYLPWSHNLLLLSKG